ncbi:MAG: fatty-acyl-CoA synthase [Cellvibrionaceae bacterium]|jgi:fatty-acyl-CoA synthase
MNLSKWVTTNAAFSPNKAALHFNDQTWSYSEMAAEVERVASILQHELGIKKGDRVGILSHNRPEFLSLLFACAKLGAILNPINWRLALPELMFIVQNAELSVLFVTELFDSIEKPLAEQLPSCQVVGLDYRPTHNPNSKFWQDLGQSTKLTKAIGMLDDPLMLVYTSGTTGRPKGAVLTQSNLQWNAFNAIHMMNLTSEDHVLTMLPLFHVGGLNNQTTPALCVGATVTLHDNVVPDKILESIGSSEQERPTVTCVVPAIMAACIASPHWNKTDFSNLRLTITGSTLVPTNLSDSFRDQGVAVLEMYGLTETAPVSVYHRPDSDFSKTGSTGMAGLYSEIRIVGSNGKEVGPNEEGEVLIKGANVMVEYWRNPEATAEVFGRLSGQLDEAHNVGWFHSGDIGYLDEDGYLYIKDRKKNMIISGSENIYAAEVERVIYEHPAVAECALIGRPDTKWGEIPVAIIAAKPGKTLTEAEMREFMQGRLARYKLPKAYIFTDELPKNAMGKIQHFLVRELFREV